MPTYLFTRRWFEQSSAQLTVVFVNDYILALSSEDYFRSLVVSWPIVQKERTRRERERLLLHHSMINSSPALTLSSQRIKGTLKVKYFRVWNFKVETVLKKMRLAKKADSKKSKILSLPTHGIGRLTVFHKDRAKNADFFISTIIWNQSYFFQNSL